MFRPKRKDDDGVSAKKNEGQVIGASPAANSKSAKEKGPDVSNTRARKKLQSPSAFWKKYSPEKKGKPLPIPKPKKIAKPAPVSSIYGISYRLLNDRIKFLYPRLTGLEAHLAKAMMRIPYEAYICGMVMMGIVAGAAGLVIGFVITAMVVITPPEFETVLPFITGMVAFQATFAAMYLIPSTNASSRKRKLGEELPFFIGYMAMLASSSLTIEGIFRTIAKDRTDEEIVKDSAFIMRNVDLLGMDILSSIDLMAKRSPHPSYTELLEGLIATVITGGNLTSYFSSNLKVMMEEKRMYLRKLTETMSIMAEMYTIMLVVFPLMAVIMLAIMAIMTPNLGGFRLDTLIPLMTYGFVPILGAMMLLMIDSMLPKK